jgi:uracil-DNA glycosylase family 4
VKLQLLDQLASEWSGCKRCDLSGSRSKVVNWRGDPGAKLFLIGEAPGADEDALGLPFVGAPGRLVDELLKRTGLQPSDVFIANAVGCRPPGNRPPERDEIRACAPRLQMMLRIVRPRALLLLGATAARLAGVTSVLAHRGDGHQVDVLCDDGEVRSWPAVITWHPAFLMRTGGQAGERFQESLTDFHKAWKLAQFS